MAMWYFEESDVILHQFDLLSVCQFINFFPEIHRLIIIWMNVVLLHLKHLVRYLAILKLLPVDLD